MQLVYTSRPRFDVRGAEGERILREFARAAQRVDNGAEISGVLMVGQDWMAQILEGDSATLNPVFRQILADDRHENLRLLSMQMTSGRKFGPACDILRSPAADAMSHTELGNLNAEDFLRMARAANGR
jgi:hypothetical protein